MITDQLRSTVYLIDPDQGIHGSVSDIEILVSVGVRETGRDLSVIAGLVGGGLGLRKERCQSGDGDESAVGEAGSAALGV
jgi:hypothetical protein